MFKKLQNKRGLFGLDDWFVIGAIATIVAAVILTPKHRVREAIKRCEVNGGISCKATVDAMSVAQVKEYIRDTVANPQPAEWKR